MKKCPYRFGLPDKKQGCITHECEFYTHLIGNHPQTGQPIDQWGCAIPWQVIVTIENSQQQRQTAASVDKVASQINRQRAEFIGALPEEARNRLVQSDVKLIESHVNAPK